MQNIDEIARKILSKRIGKSTQAEYLRVAKRSADKSIDEIASLPKSSRRVVVAASKRQLALEVKSGAAGSREKLGVLCDRFPDFEAYESKLRNRTFADIFQAQLSSTDTVRTLTKTKKRTLALLPDDWRERMLRRALSAPKRTYVAPIAVLWATGARPEELRRGIVLKLDHASNAIVAQIDCAKTRRTRQIRTITFAGESSLAALLLSRALGRLEPGKTITVQVESKTALTNALRRYGNTFGIREDVTPYCFRHQFAADQKSAEIGSLDLARALGHSTDQMGSRYGARQQGKSGATLVRPTSTLEPTPQKALQLAKLKQRALSREHTR